MSGKKNRLAAGLAALLGALALFGGCTESGLTKVTVNEVTHSVFYAPQYAAMELGYLKKRASRSIWSTAAGRTNP